MLHAFLTSNIARSALKKYKKMENENLRFYIQLRFKLGIDATRIHNDFKSTLGDKAPSYSFVTKWIHFFKEGRENLEDEQRIGRPITATVPTNIDAVRNFIEEDPYCTYDEIEAETSFNQYTIQTILHDHLHLRKITSRWVPHELSAKNRQDRVRMCKENLDKFESGAWRLCDVVTGDESWFYWRQIGRKQSNACWVATGESPRTVVRQGRFEPKTLVCIFFRESGVQHITYWDKGETVDNISYVNDCLKPLVKVINKQRPAYGCKNLKFHHDNARPHVHQNVVNYLKEQNFILMDHPPYSPDLAPCDFWLFDYIKQRLTDHTSEKSLISQITAIVDSISKEDLQKTFNKWIERMQLCVKNKGDYFEHLINKI
jgi:histone-lysine N-methyltransferase SETMAR